MITEWWTQVSATVLHGLQITVEGMLLVFFALGLVIIAMVLLTKLPWLRAEPNSKEPPAQSAAPQAASSAPQTAAAAPQDDELAQIAAIAVALLKAQPTAPISRGLSRPHIRPTGSAWKSYGRAQQLGL